MANKIIPYGKQHITGEDVKEVIDALMSSHITQGPRITEFEENFAKYVGARFAVAVSNGTAALHLAALALGLKEGDKVITTPITFAASANCIRFCGADVVFADINPDTYLLNIDNVKKILESSPKGTYKGIIPVDFAGRVVDLEAFRKLADEYGLWIIEDACHAPGGFFLDSSGNSGNAGNGKFADLSVFSFHPVKHIACGEGGMITTDDEELYKQLNRLRSHGITKGDDEYTNSEVFANGGDDHAVGYPGWYMEMQYLGYNYRLTDIQAALGNSQLQRADDGMKKRKEIAKRYDGFFSGKDYVLGQSGFIEGHAYHLYVLEVKDRLGLYNHLREKNIYAQIHYIPCHLMPYYRDLGWKEGDLPYAENYYKNCISIPVYPTLSKEDQDFVKNTINGYYEK
ncbi:UDP-4-amino-4,6-dideoxy-N-acetyl-beta-L-altrosamine transaminase [uncultured Chryseobacterium sp.]|uniref:UDP-4-amino-4, 6-dideoxy-N-acetyl-beta-L-altrosamine transaminase n=1 Tax=uncultured Chryseobacterium sp. TaxID=259322 RepID=UPI0025CC20D5|nr:UDP-4-amino-4,6-dideoxy-N-acetyl-beta-L-altrosamine transaminase [uncultured Chryseobacterium sp.]